MEDNKNYIGYLKYSGKFVEDGLLDARKLSDALSGFDKVLKHFLYKENPKLSKIDFGIPIRMKKGSVVFLLPEAIDKYWALVGGGVGIGAAIIGGVAAITYVKETAKIAAKDGLFETGIAKDISKMFKRSCITIQWMIKIAKHCKGLKKIDKENIVVKPKTGGVTYYIKNNENELLETQKEYIDKFNQCPENIFEKIAAIIEAERTLEFGVYEKNGIVTKETITENDKYIFIKEQSEEEEILPELIHGEIMTLIGKITQVTEKKISSIEFLYKNIEITCKPMQPQENIAKFKNNIISERYGNFFQKNVKLTGKIDRIDDNGNPKRISIRIIKIKPILSGQSGMLGL